MASCNLSNTRSIKLFLNLSLLLIIFIFFLPFANPLSFNYSLFQSNEPSLDYQGDAFAANGLLQLTKNQIGQSLTGSIGRVTYHQPIHLWDSKTNTVADFTTHFSFIINALNASRYGDGIAFFLAPVGSGIPPNSSGGFLGLFDNSTLNSTTKNTMVAVEFDSFANPWDPNDNHIGINVNSIVSVANVTWNSSIRDGRIANAWVSYNATAKKLSVFLTYADNQTFDGSSSLSHDVDLKAVLPEQVIVGFSSSTGTFTEIHTILSWEFSSLDLDGGAKKSKIGWVVGLVVSIGVLVCSLGLVWVILWRKRMIRRKEEEIEMGFDESLDDDFERGTGPKRFTYKELVSATNGFSEEGKLGQGGFGGVYRGFLKDLNMAVAVKKISKGSRQGKKEYVSEVKIISRLRHRNLVQLIGWSHDRGEFVLVYEFMSNGSLDSHLFGKKSSLTWGVRYKIAMGLASALLYLHEEWEQCVVHRDIKSSNVMLDSGFNAKLGDFGLARLVDHELGSQTTVLAGTTGYMAPECVTTGKASKESDVFSFGVVALEIACGRRPVEPEAEEAKVRMVEWVWGLYGRGMAFDAADESLNMDFDEKEMEVLMVVGLWCAHPDYSMRPTIRQAIQVLNFEAPLPVLPAKMPVPMYFAPPMNECRFSYGLSTGTGDSERDRSRCTCSSCTSTSKSAMSTGSSPSVSLLHSHKG